MVRAAQPGRVIDLQTRRARKHGVGGYRRAGLARVDKTGMMIGLYEKERILAETITCRSVEVCQAMVEKTVNELLVRDVVGLRDIAYRVTGVVSAVSDMVKAEFTTRFQRKPLDMDLRVSLTGLDEAYGLLLEWQEMKEATLSMARLSEQSLNQVWGDVVSSYFGHGISVKILGEINVLQPLLRAVGVDSKREEEELNQGLNQRLTVYKLAVQIRLVKVLQKQIADLFYRTHDQLIDLRLQTKINRLRKKLAEAKFSDAIEA